MSTLLTRKRILVGIVTLAGVTIGGSAFFMLHQGSKYPVDWTGRSEVNIKLTARGFVPEMVYVSNGTKITFSTVLDEPFWPASNVHPFHTVYPEFDSRAPVSPGSTWSFVFNKNGRWTYHDHVAATKSGVVIVVPSGEKGEDKFNISAQCDQTHKEAQYSCWYEQLRYALESKGVDAVFDELSRLYKSDSNFFKKCHSLTHDIGLLAYAQSGIATNILEKTGYCNDGFWHGFMEGFFVDHQDPADAYAFCEEIRKKFGATYPLAFTQCHHGIGHGGAEYLINSRTDLWGAIPKLAALFVPLCQDMGVDKRNCAYGTYSTLANWMFVQKRYDTLLDAQSFVSLCADATESWAREGCMFEFSKRMHFYPTQNPADIFPQILKYGNTIDEGAYIPLMVEGGAMSMSQFSQHVEDDKLIQPCRALPPSLRTACLQGVTQGLFFSAAPGDEPERVARFCLSNVLSADEQATCVATEINLVVNSYASGALKEVCLLFPDDLISDIKMCADTLQ